MRGKQVRRVVLTDSHGRNPTILQKKKKKTTILPKDLNRLISERHTSYMLSEGGKILIENALVLA